MSDRLEYQYGGHSVKADGFFEMLSNNINNNNFLIALMLIVTSIALILYRRNTPNQNRVRQTITNTNVGTDGSITQSVNPRSFFGKNNTEAEQSIENAKVQRDAAVKQKLT
jgi:hypothetical protein